MRSLASVTAVALLALGACAGPSEPTASSVTPHAQVARADLLGLWGADPTTAQDERLPWLRLDYDGQFTGFDGCNQVAGTWTYAGRVVAAPTAATTAVACTPEVEASFDAMTPSPEGLEYTVDGTTRVMATGDRPDITMFVLGRDSQLLEAVPATYWPLSTIGDPGSNAMAAVQALIGSDPRKGSAYGTLWGRMCAPGRKVRAIETTTTSATVTLAGRGGELCDLSPEGSMRRRQQLAWTVVDNLGVDPSTTVRLASESGERLWEDTVPDRAQLAPG